MTAPDNSRAARSRRLLIAFSFLVVGLTFAGALSFVQYARRPNPTPGRRRGALRHLRPGLEPWRVRLAEGLTAQLDSMPPLAAVSQAVVRGAGGVNRVPRLPPWTCAPWRTSAGLAIYGRLDPLAGTHDSIRVRMITIDSGTGQVLISVDRRWATAQLGDLSRTLAEQVRQNYRSPID
jgi:hypothetical protein